MNHRSIIFSLCLTCFLISCTSSPAPVENISETNVQVPSVAVRTTPARKGAFSLRIFSSGTLKAAEKAPVHVQISGTVKELPVQEGASLKSGDLIVKLEDEALQLRLAQARATLDEATIEKKDLLVMQRGNANDDSSVPPERLASILTLSGYTRASLAVRQAELELAQSKVCAPFGGVVADLKVKRYQHVGSGSEICTLINTASFEAEFSLLEREVVQVAVGQQVRVQPAASADREYSGVVTVINPVVSEKGLVLVRARVNIPPRSRLLEGMNVHVIIERKVADQVVVPKSALVMRSGRPVIFTYNASKKLARWNYVTIAYENDRDLAISDGIKPGDEVIYEGNLNLDHDAAVTITPKGSQR